ncbi:MAG TPA: serine/threonine-protein kinase [Polyangiaceae bacterium]|nr:serine/threonine-protein kinase [Polyangiaceae bacterium]
MTALLRLPELAKYELLEEIGHGGMATVYRARDRRLGREVAVKLIHRHLRDSSEVAERFVREATAVAKLRHPSIVEVFDISDPDEPERYLVVELVRGLTLRERLRSGPLPPEVAAAVALEVGAGLEHAHSQGVIHRDVKPENVLIELPRAGEGGERTPLRMKLTDFGIAKLLDAQGVTSTGQVLGSPAHMAPEQIEGGAVDARTDVFALGVLLYEAMVGRLPFHGDHPAQVLRRVLDGDFSPAERQDPRVGAGYSRLISRALARQREDRFESVQALLDALRQELATLGYSKLQPLLEAVMRPDPQFEDELVSRLVERGTAARQDGQIAVAAEYFGRALAYRPGDRQLLRRVSGLARDRELRRLLRGAAVVGAAAALGMVLYRQSGPARERPELAPPLAHEVPRSAAASAPVGAPAVAAGVGEAHEAPAAGAAGASGEAAPLSGAAAQPPDSSAGKGEAAARPATPSRAGNRRSPAGGGEAEPVGSRDVVVRITGATGGTLRIDGAPVQWFGDVRHSLTLGPHRFEFVAPDSNCCVSSERTVNVIAGEGPQQVNGEIPFLDAIVRVSAEEGVSGLLTCPSLFPGDQRFPGDVHIKMSRVSVGPVTCTLRGDDSSAPPQRSEVTLRAGQTQVIPWP